MPAFPPTSHLNTLVTRNASATIATNATALQVVCAWPVSGQYGPGSRVLYYVLVAACVFARKADWLKGACLAAALLFPAVAALHGIVLAALHIDSAVDMDVYGAFQLCSIGILAAPVTVRLSRTYFFDPGRNIIFVWTLLILAGLLSLTVEFFRIKTQPCTHDDSGNPVFFNAGNFSYTTSCGLLCDPNKGPYSPMRKGSANNIYVIPAPNKLTFGTATLFAAACCIPAILSLVSMWNKILEINWKSRFGNRQKDERIDEPIAGTNGATLKKIMNVNSLISFFLSAVEIPVFVAAVLAILIIGERNFFSNPVKFQTEPIASIGQWAPIVGTGLAVLGSLYILLAKDDADQETETEESSVHHCNCSMHEVGVNHIETASSHSDVPPYATDMQRSSSNGGVVTSSEIRPSMTHRSSPGPTYQPRRSGTIRTTGTTDLGNRRKVAKTLTAIGTYLGTAAPDRFDDSEFKRGKALDYPELPGEELRNENLPQIRRDYNKSREEDDENVLHMHHSRTGSYAGSIASRRSAEVGSSRAASPHSPPLQNDRTSFDVPNQTGGMRRTRRDTLEVPSPSHLNPSRNNTLFPSITIPYGQGSPAIMVSPDPDTPSPAHTPGLSPPASPTHSERLPTPPSASLPPSR